ncbi:MAG: hypothetical protein C5B46_00415 [Proteobacteria bacterium]|nr:MAG: hypothetical protein C5B46_00415 [Pseudomonadota bacterium]
MDLRFDELLARVSRNYAFLRRAVDSAGRALAKQPYESFLEPIELSFTEFVEGTEVQFSVEVFRADSDGTLWVHVAPHAQLSTPLRLRPSFVFRKLRDGTAYVMR